MNGDLIKNILLIIAYFISATELFFAAYFWKTNGGNTVRKIMAALLLATGLWVGNTAITTYRAPGPLVDFLATMVYVISTFSLTLLLHLALIWPVPMKWMSVKRVTSLYIPPVFFGILLLLAKTVVSKNVAASNYYGHSEPGPLFIIYNLYLLALFISAAIVAYRRAYPKINRLSDYAGMFFWSVLFSGLVPATLDLVMVPLFKMDVNPLFGVIPNVVFIGTIGYIVSRR